MPSTLVKRENTRKTPTWTNAPNRRRIRFCVCVWYFSRAQHLSVEEERKKYFLSNVYQNRWCYSSGRSPLKPKCFFFDASVLARTKYLVLSSDNSKGKFRQENFESRERNSWKLMNDSRAETSSAPNYVKKSFQTWGI